MANKPDSKTPTTPAADVQPVTAGRVTVSALVYGAAGGLIGWAVGWFGARGGRHHSEWFLGISGAIAGAFISAFSALKEEHREEDVAADKIETAYQQAKAVAQGPSTKVKTGDLERAALVEDAPQIAR